MSFIRKRPFIEHPCENRLMTCYSDSSFNLFVYQNPPRIFNIMIMIMIIITVKHRTLFSPWLSDLRFIPFMLQATELNFFLQRIVS